MRKIFLPLLLTVAIFAEQIIVTGVNVTSECKKTEDNKDLSMSFWAEGCPYTSGTALRNALISKANYFDTIPTCDMPQEPLPAPLPPTLGEHFDQEIPEGYELVDENITNETNQTYPAYNGLDTVYDDLHELHGSCSGMSANYWWKADEHKGFIYAKYFSRVYEKTCDEENKQLPQPAENEQILLSWNEDNDKSQTCLDLNGTVQEGKANCKAIFQCIKKTDSCPTIPVEPISSYVNPKDRLFHEDISLDGLTFGLHYRSSDFNSSNNLAKGWSLSNHHAFIDGKLHLGSGIVLVAISTTTEGENILINSGGEVYVFDASLKHIETRDAYTKRKLFSFSYENEKLVSITDEFEQTTSLEYDADGNISSIVAPYGQTTAFALNTDGDLIEVQYEDGSSYAFEYDNHLMTKETEANGNVFLHIFDAEGKVTKVIDAEQGEWSFNNEQSSFGTKTVHRASGDTVRYKNYSVENGMLKFETIMSSGEVITTLKAVDDSQESRTSCGVTTTQKYKMANGKLVRDPINHRRVLESITTKTPSGLIKKLQLNKTFTLDANGALERLTLNSTLNGKTATSIRDYLAHTATQTTPLGKVNKVKYRADNTLVKWSKAYGLHKTNYSYDSEGRVTKVKRGNRVTRYRYDARGNLKSIKDAKGRVTRYEYDSRDRLVKTIYPNGNTLQNSYDKNGNMTVLTTPTPSDHTFTYNGVNKRTSMKSALLATTAYEYDKVRRVTKITRPSGKTIENHFTNEKLTSTTTAEGTTTYTYACQGNVATKTKGTESIAYEYDGTLLTKATQTGVLNQTLNMTYNNDFLLSSFSYANTTTNYIYNQDNEPTKIGDYEITRGDKNRKVEVSDGTYKQTKTFNKYGELTKLKNKRTLVELSYNKNGQIVKKVEKIKHKRVVYKYTYDKVGRLTKVKKGNKVVESYTYDKNGNRASATVNGVSTTGSYTLDDQLVVYGDNTYHYDNDGYLIEKTTPNGTTTYEYRTLGELKKVVTPTKTIEYKHNANNQRVAKLINGEVVEKYLWANLTTLLSIYDKDDNLVQRFEYANGRMPTSMTSNGQKYYLHYDQVGTLKAVTDTTHNIIKEISYDTYGNILSDNNPSFKVPFGFAGGLYDTDTKLTRFGYRDYDAYTGKWTAKDPIDFGGGDSNLYGYVLQDPVNFVDPSGLVNQNFFNHDDLLYVPGFWMGTFTPNYTVGGHGSRGEMSNPDGSLLTPLELANIIKSDPDFNGQPIEMYVCNAGTGGEDSFANQLANLLNTTVSAPNGYYLYPSLIGFHGPEEGAEMLTFPIKKK